MKHIFVCREYELLLEELSELRDQYVATQAELSSAREEKKTFDEALQTLKDDMRRVSNLSQSLNKAVPDSKILDLPKVHWSSQ